MAGELPFAFHPQNCGRKSQCSGQRATGKPEGFHRPAVEPSYDTRTPQVRKGSSGGLRSRLTAEGPGFPSCSDAGSWLNSRLPLER